MNNYSRTYWLCRWITVASFLTMMILFGLISNVEATGLRLDASFNTGTLLTRGFIRAMAVQPDGKIIIGGFYTLANGSERSCLVRVNADGSLDDSFNTGTGPNSYVETIILRADGKSVIGGSFTTFNGVTRNRIARLNADGSLDTSFDPVTGASSTVYAIAQAPDNDLYLGGSFTSFNSISRPRIARLNEDGSVDTGFDPGTGANSVVYDVKLQTDGNVLIGGGFSFVNGVFRRRVARLNSFGGLDTSFVSGLSSQIAFVRSLAIQTDAKIVVGSDAGFNSPGMTRLNPNGSVDNNFSISTLNVGIRTLSLQTDGKIVAGGSFNNLNGRRNIARFGTNGTLDPTFLPGAGANADVNAVALQSDGKILIGGDFYHFNGNANDIVSVVRLIPDGATDSSFSFSTRTPGVVYDLKVLSNGKILIVGDFVEINGRRQHDVARLNANGSPDTTFDQLYGTDGYSVNSLIRQGDGKLIIGGRFTEVNYASHDNIARLNADGTLDGTFSPSADLDVRDMELQPDGKVIIGGFFSNVNGSARAGIARLNANGSLDMSFTPRNDLFYSAVYDVAIQPNGKIIMGGTIFDSFATPLNITRLNDDGSDDLSFNIGVGPDFIVLTMAIQPDDKIVIGGAFSNVGGISRNRIARLNADGSVDNSFNPGTGANSDVEAVELQEDNRLLVGGYFTSFNGVPRTGIARLDPDGSLDSTFNFSINNGVVEAIGFQPDGKILLGGYRITPSTGIVRLLLPNAPFDFDGDGKTDVSVFRPSSGYWYISNSANNSFRAEPFGIAGDLIVPADYEGDTKTDTAVFRPATGYWYFLNSSNGSFRFTQFGQTGDVPAPGDYDGDGKSDIAVYRPTTGFFYFLRSTDGMFQFVQWGQAGDQPIMGDYDGDGKSDFGIFRPSISTFYVLRSSDGGVIGQQFGQNGDKPIAGDFDGDRETDTAVYRPTSGEWYYVQSSDNGFRGVAWGAVGDIPSAGDYDGDGKWDIAVFRPSTGVFYILQSTDNSLRSQQFGTNGDVPVSSAYVP